MHHFNYKGGELYCEEIPIQKIADKVGTPFYCYSQATLTRHVQQFCDPFKGVKALPCYAVKANSNIAILKLLFSLGCGADIVSAGELYRVIKAGGDRRKVVFSGVGKTGSEIEYALKEKILCLNVESAQELDLISIVAKRLKLKAPISIRVNPDIDPKTHPHISTGLLENKFGIPLKEAINLFHKASKDKNLKVIGIDCHIGSQVTKIEPFLDALRSIKATILKLKKDGITISHLDIGGGLGITYNDESPPHPKDYAKAVIKELKGLDITLVMEPGRVIVGNAGILVTKVLYTKTGPKKEFVIVDAAMNDLIRPVLYDAHQKIIPVTEPKKVGAKIVDVVGPVCETGDFLARARKLPSVTQGNLLAIMSAGAYGFSMSSNYNSRPRIPEVLVNGKELAVVRRRETLDDLLLGEKIPKWLEG